MNGEAVGEWMPDAVENLERLLAEAAPGPWTVDRTAAPTYERYEVLGSDGFPINTQGVEPFETFELANADLIAAAPLLAKHLIALAKALQTAEGYIAMDGRLDTTAYDIVADALAAFERDFGGGEA